MTLLLLHLDVKNIFKDNMRFDTINVPVPVVVVHCGNCASLSGALLPDYRLCNILMPRTLKHKVKMVSVSDKFTTNPGAWAQRLNFHS